MSTSFLKKVFLDTTKLPPILILPDIPAPPEITNAPVLNEVDPVLFKIATFPLKKLFDDTSNVLRM